MMHVMVKRMRYAYTTPELHGIGRRKLHNLASRVIPFDANNLARMVHTNLSHRWREVRRVVRRRPEIVRRNRHLSLHLPTLERVSKTEPSFFFPSFSGKVRGHKTHGLGGCLIAAWFSDVGDTANSHGVECNRRGCKVVRTSVESGT